MMISGQGYERFIVVLKDLNRCTREKIVKLVIEKIKRMIL